MLPRVVNCNISTRPIPEDDLLESDSSSSSECELSFTQDRFGMSWRSGLISGTSSRRVVINDTPQPLRPGDKKHRAIYSSGHSQYSPPRSILRTPSVNKTKSHVTHIGTNKKEKTKQVDILRVHSNTSRSKTDFPTRKTIQNPFPANMQYKNTMETIPQQNCHEIKLVSFLKQLLREFQNLIECLASTKEELSKAEIDQTPISTVYDLLSESLGELNLLINNKILAKENVDYLSIAETLKLIISYIITTTQGLSEQYWKLQEEIHSVGQERRLLRQCKEALTQEQQELHHVLEVSKAQLLSEKNELRSKQNSVAAAKLELLKQCSTLGNRKLATDGTHRRHRVTRPPAISNMTSTERSRAKHTLEMSNLREVNKIAKAELAEAQGTVLQLQQQMEKQYQESQKRTKDLTRRLQQAEDTMKMAAGVLRDDRRKYPDMTKPKKYNAQKAKPQDIQYGTHKRQHRHQTNDQDTEQLWERASRFIRQEDKSHKLSPYQSELTNKRTITKRSKKTTAVHSYSKPSTDSQVAKWLNNYHT